MEKHILVIEDEERWRNTLVEVLLTQGYSVSDVSSGEQALEWIKMAAPSDHFPFDVVVTDIVLGKVNGVEITQSVRSYSDPPEVIILTGYGALETSLQAMRAGAFDYLLKPVAIPTLLQRIADSFEARFSRRELRERSELLDKIRGMIGQEPEIET